MWTQFFLGYSVWYFTGIDDILVLVSLLLVASRRKVVGVATGTLAGVLMMLGFCALVRGGIFAAITPEIDTLENGVNIRDFLQLVGLVPLVLGFHQLQKILRQTPAHSDNAGDGDTTAEATGAVEQTENGSFWGGFSAALGIYLGNSTDDVIVITSLAVNASLSSAITLAVGVFVGCASSILGARLLANSLARYQRALGGVAGFALMGIGFAILVDWL